MLLAIKWTAVPRETLIILPALHRFKTVVVILKFRMAGKKIDIYTWVGYVEKNTAFDLQFSHDEF